MLTMRHDRMILNRGKLYILNVLGMLNVLAGCCNLMRLV